MSIHVYIEGLSPPHYSDWIRFVDTLSLQALIETAAELTESEEWRVVDHDGIGFDIDAFISPEDLLEIAEWCAASGNADIRVRKACAVVAATELGGVSAETLRTARTRCVGSFTEPGGYARQLHRDVAERLGVLAPYVDFAALEHDLVAAGAVGLIEVDGLGCFFTSSPQ